MTWLFWLPVNVVQGIFAAFWTAFSISMALIVRLLTGSARPGLRMARWLWAPPIVRVLGLRVEIAGLEHLDPERSCFIAINHQSILDALVLFFSIPVELAFVVRSDLMGVPFFGWYVRAMGMTILDRDHQLRGLAAMRRTTTRLADGRSVILFPEGTRSRDGRVGAFKPGAFVPAIEAGVPVVPAAMDGPGRLLPAGTLKARPGTVRIVLGEAIETEGLEVGDRRDLSRQVRDRVLELHEHLVGLSAP